MSIEIKNKNGKTIGLIDREDGEDYVVVKNKKIALSDVYQDKELLNEFNDEIKNSEVELNNDSE